MAQEQALFSFGIRSCVSRGFFGTSPSAAHRQGEYRCYFSSVLPSLQTGIRNSGEYVWWVFKTPWPKASNLSVLKEYSEDMIRLNRNGVRGTVRPSGHVIRNSFDKIDAGGAIPTNVTEADLVEVPESMLKMGNNAAN